MKARIINMPYLPLKEGDKVKIHFSRIVNKSTAKNLSKKYVEFLDENKDKVFTVEKPTGTLGNMPRVWSFAEDETDPKWGFHESDLIRV